MKRCYQRGMQDHLTEYYRTHRHDLLADTPLRQRLKDGNAPVLHDYYQKLAQGTLLPHGWKAPDAALDIDDHLAETRALLKLLQGLNQRLPDVLRETRPHQRKNPQQELVNDQAMAEDQLDEWALITQQALEAVRLDGLKEERSEFFQELAGRLEPWVRNPAERARMATAHRQCWAELEATLMDAGQQWSQLEELAEERRSEMGSYAAGVADEAIQFCRHRVFPRLKELNGMVKEDMQILHRQLKDLKPLRKDEAGTWTRQPDPLQESKVLNLDDFRPGGSRTSR